MIGYKYKGLEKRKETRATFLFNSSIDQNKEYKMIEMITKFESINEFTINGVLFSFHMHSQINSYDTKIKMKTKTKKKPL